MTWIVPLAYALSVAATLTAWTVARERAEHRPIAYLLTAGLALDGARRLLLFTVIAPARIANGGAPFEGATRAVWHVHQAFYLAWPACLAATAIVVFLRRRAWPVLIAWALAVVALASTYPLTRGALLARCYLGIELAALLVSFGALATWVRRLRSPELHYVSLAIVMVAETCVVVFGPWSRDVFGTWAMAQVGYSTLYAVLVLLQGGSKWISVSSSSQS